LVSTNPSLVYWGKEEESMLSGMSGNMAANKTIQIYYSGEAADMLQYEDAFLLDAELLEKIDYPEEWIRETGSQNQGIVVGRELEFLCRLLEKKGSCVVVHTQPRKNQRISLDDLAYTYAYMVRRHMDPLHVRQLMEQVFQGICSLMQRKGCFTQFQQALNLFLSDENAYERLAVNTAPFLVLRGDDTCGGLLQLFADELSEGLATNGQAVIEYGGSTEIEEGDGTDPLIDFEKGIWKGIVGFQAPALELPFFRKLKGPKFQFWFDNPFGFQSMLHQLPEDYYVLCQDGDYADWIRRYYHTQAIHFPPGGIELPFEEMDRPIDIVFVGSLFSDATSHLTQEQKYFFDYEIHHPWLNFEQAALELYGEREDLPRLLHELQPACRAIIGYYRRLVVETILEAGITLHVYGEDWHGYQGKGRERLVIHPHIPVKESLKEFQRAKIGLNIMSWHKDGMTERVANLMLSGAVCLSDETKFLREQFAVGEEIELYRLDALEELPIRIQELLGNEEKRRHIANRAYARAKQDFNWEARARELAKLAQNHREEERLRIYVCTHVKCNSPDLPIYVPLHVGRKGKADLGYIGDDTGENISDLNFLYGELTGLFWIWQNVNDIDYVGMCHYRRYFISDQLKELRKEEYLELLTTCDAIVPKHMEVVGKNYYEHFGRAHNSRDLDAVERALKRLYPEYGPAYDEAMSGKIFYWGNLMVTSLPILKAYAEWLFTIFLEAGEEIDVSGYDDYHKRVYGFLSEQMFYVFALTNHLKLGEVAVGISAEKAETEEMKNALKKMMAEGRNKEALHFLEEKLKKRPDLLLQGSDVNGELSAIYAELKKV